LITSPCSKAAIRFLVRFGIPFVERAERIIAFLPTARFGENHAILLNLIDELIALLEAKGGSNRLRDRGLRLARQSARDHRRISSVRIFLTVGIILTACKPIGMPAFVKPHGTLIVML
jgi:hypothetical protein